MATVPLEAHAFAHKKEVVSPWPYSELAAKQSSKRGTHLHVHGRGGYNRKYSGGRLEQLFTIQFETTHLTKPISGVSNAMRVDMPRVCFVVLPILKTDQRETRRRRQEKTSLTSCRWVMPSVKGENVYHPQIPAERSSDSAE